MRGRAKFGALGLRGRIIGVVLVTAAAALAVAAATVLARLESSLKKAEATALRSEVGEASGVLRPFKADGLGGQPWQVYYSLIYPSGHDSPGPAVSQAAVTRAEALRDRLSATASRLESRINADVALLGDPGVDGRGARAIVIEPTPSSLAGADTYSDAPRAFATGRKGYSFATIDGTDYAREILPFTTGAGPTKHSWALVVRKQISEVSHAVSAVRAALLDAALVAAALTVLLAIPLAVTVVRRLRLLRQAALRVAQEGPNVEFPVDRALDEVGDLARTFALMQQQLRRQEEARRAFVATASHELRTPVASLDGLLELLDEDLQSGQADLEDARSLIARARRQSRRLGRLAADLLDLSRIDAQVELRSEPVELGELSRAVLAEFELGTADRQISTALDDAIGPVWAMGDPGSVARIVRILVDNAVRLSPAGSEITIELRNGDRASISVCDQGPGVANEERDLIFERFMRGRQVTGAPGFGLGLAIGRELAERMGGELVLEDHDGPGARFTLRLPVAQAPDAEPVAVA
jgi:signal transduction histidine kinase